MYSKNGIPWVRPPTHDGQHRENNIGRTCLPLVLRGLLQA